MLNLYIQIKNQDRRSSPHYWSKLCIISCLALTSASLHADEIEPRSFSNTPVGINFLIGAYAYTQGGLSAGASTPLSNANLTAHNTALAYVRSLDLWGQSGKFDIVLPYTWLSGSAEYAGTPITRETQGLSTPSLRLSMNFLGAPALSLKEFADYKQDIIVGGSLRLGLPDGEYNADKIVNLGTNRWYIKPELGMSKAWDAWTLELSTAATFFSDNNDYFGGHTLAQDPLYSFQGHVIYNLERGMWLAVTGTYFTGGRTHLDGVSGDDLQASTRAGITFAKPIDRHQSIKLNATTGLSIRTGTDFDSIGIAWQYRWGGGL